jgi:hypothetical protein
MVGNWNTKGAKDDHEKCEKRECFVIFVPFRGFRDPNVFMIGN